MFRKIGRCTKERKGDGCLRERKKDAFETEVFHIEGRTSRADELEPGRHAGDVVTPRTETKRSLLRHTEIAANVAPQQNPTMDKRWPVLTGF